MNSLYFDKMHMLYNQNKSCVKSCQNTLLKTNTHCFPKKNPLFSNMCTFLSHCFETKNYHCWQEFLNLLFALFFSFRFKLSVKKHFLSLHVVISLTILFYLVFLQLNYSMTIHVCVRVLDFGSNRLLKRYWKSGIVWRGYV